MDVLSQWFARFGQRRERSLKELVHASNVLHVVLELTLKYLNCMAENRLEARASLRNQIQLSL